MRRCCHYRAGPDHHEAQARDGRRHRAPGRTHPTIRAPPRLVGGTNLVGRADDDSHPGWLAEARRLWTLVHAPRFRRPGVGLARTAERARLVGLIGLIGSTPARTLPGAVAQPELVAHERGRSSGGFSGEAADAFAGALATLRRSASTGAGRGPADGEPEAA